MNELTLKFTIVEEKGSFSLYSEIAELVKDGWNDWVLYKIKSDDFTRVAANYFEVTNVIDFGAGFFGREVIDKTNNMIIARFCDTGSWRRNGMSETIYNTLYLKYYLGSFYTYREPDLNLLKSKIIDYQEKYVTSFKCLITILRNLEKANERPDFKSLSNKTYKI